MRLLTLITIVTLIILVLLTEKQVKDAEREIELLDSILTISNNQFHELERLYNERDSMCHDLVMHLKQEINKLKPKPTMKTQVTVYDLKQLLQVAARNGKVVNVHTAVLTFPMPLWTDVPEGSKESYDFPEFKETFLK